VFYTCEALSPRLAFSYTLILSILVKLPRTFVKAEQVSEPGNRVKNCGTDGKSSESAAIL
jgi:hypothetical protein